MLGKELAVSARRWSRIRESKDGREGGGSMERRFRSDSSGVCEVDEEAIGKSAYQLSDAPSTSHRDLPGCDRSANT
jgi:hypothetical protein